jgi:beta-glucosidase
VLRTKFELGLFECPYIDVAKAAAAVGSTSSREFARSLASRSIVLLRNDGTLPIDPTTTATIAVLGPNADNPRNLFGDYSYAAHIETLLEMRDSDNVFHVPIPDDLDVDADVVGERTVFGAISAAFPSATVRTAPGCSVGGDDRDGFDAAVRLAIESDIAVMVMGDKAGLTMDSTCGEGRDRSSLDLPGVQEDLVRAVVATGTPVVLVLVAGRPCGSVEAHDRSAAVVAAWLPGDEGAAAIADVLIGAVNPGGKLPVSFPRTAGHVPVYYRQKRSGGRSHWKGDYADASVSPLYPFGHGLSYTTFELASPLPTATHIDQLGEITVAVTVANTGSRDGDEVVQLYTRHPQASVTRPVLELKAFARVSVPTGEHRTVTFSVHAGQLGFYDRQLRYVLEPGAIEVYVGTSVTQLDHAGTFTISTGNGGLEIDKVFDAEVRISRGDGAPPRTGPI